MTETLIQDICRGQCCVKGEPPCHEAEPGCKPCDECVEIAARMEARSLPAALAVVLAAVREIAGMTEFSPTIPVDKTNKQNLMFTIAMLEALMPAQPGEGAEGER